MLSKDKHIFTLNRISKALNLAAGSLVSVVGGGGKTSLIGRLCEELVEDGISAVFTTTTRIQPPEGMELVLSKRPGEIKRILQGHINPFSLALGLALNREGKVTGIPPDWVVEIQKEAPSAVVLVEADGSKGMSLKAPAAHEPVIPLNSGVVVVVVGVDIVGKALLGGNVHRPEIISQLLGKDIGSVIEVEDVVNLLSHPEGGLKSIPAQASIVFFLNKADTEDAWLRAVAIASKLRQKFNQAKVILSSLHQQRFAVYR